MPLIGFGPFLGDVAAVCIAFTGGLPTLEGLGATDCIPDMLRAGPLEPLILEVFVRDKADGGSTEPEMLLEPSLAAALPVPAGLAAFEATLADLLPPLSKERVEV